MLKIQIKMHTLLILMRLLIISYLARFIQFLMCLDFYGFNFFQIFLIIMTSQIVTCLLFKPYLGDIIRYQMYHIVRKYLITIVLICKSMSINKQDV